MVSEQGHNQPYPPVRGRARNTREQLLHAGAVEIARLGYKQASVTRICRKAGVTTGALYSHFPTKWAMAEELLQRQRVRVNELAGHVGETLPAALDRLLCFSSDLAELIVSDAGVRACLQISTERSLPPRSQVWQHWALLADALETSAHLPSCAATMSPRFGATSIALLIGAWISTRDGTEPDFDCLLRQLWEIVARGAVDEANQASATASVEIIFGRTSPSAP